MLQKSREISIEAVSRAEVPRHSRMKTFPPPLLRPEDRSGSKLSSRARQTQKGRESSPPRDFSRDGDTARRGRYTSRRRVANFPRRGFSIIPLAARLHRRRRARSRAQRDEEEGGRRLHGERMVKRGLPPSWMVVVEMTASSLASPSFPLSSLHTRARHTTTAPCGSIWLIGSPW